MTQTPTLTAPDAARQPVAAIRRAGGYAAELLPDAAWRDALAKDLGLLALRKLRFTISVVPIDGGLTLTGHLGATVVQPCVVTLDPVTTRIDAPVARSYVEDLPEPEGEEVEIPEDDSLEPLGTVLDLAELLAEALALNLPLYPRRPGAELGEAVFTEDGTAPLTEEAVKPFAQLQGLKDKLDDDTPEDDT